MGSLWHTWIASVTTLALQGHYEVEQGWLTAVTMCWITKTAARWLTVGNTPQTLKSRDSRAGQTAQDFITLLKREGNFIFWGRPGGVKGKELACQCRRHKRHAFHPWVGKSPQEEIMATRSSVLAWRIPWTVEPGWYSPLRCKELDMTEEKAMAPHSSTLAWKIPWTEEPGRLQSMGSLRVGHDWFHFHFSLSCIGEENGNPLQCSCLENPREGGAWWAAVYGVAESDTTEVT